MALFQPYPISVNAAAPQQQQPIPPAIFTPIVTGPLLPILGSLIVLGLVLAWDKIFYVPVVIGLCAVIFLWLTQPNK